MTISNGSFPITHPSRFAWKIVNRTKRLEKSHFRDLSSRLLWLTLRSVGRSLNYSLYPSHDHVSEISLSQD